MIRKAALLEGDEHERSQARAGCIGHFAVQSGYRPHGQAAVRRLLYFPHTLAQFRRIEVWFLLPISRKKSARCSPVMASYSALSSSPASKAVNLALRAFARQRSGISLQETELSKSRLTLAMTWVFLIHSRRIVAICCISGFGESSSKE